MKYAIVDSHSGSCWIDKFDSKEEALREAEWQWRNKSKWEKERADEFAVVGYEDDEAFEECEEVDEIVKSFVGGAK